MVNSASRALLQPAAKAVFTLNVTWSDSAEALASLLLSTQTSQTIVNEAKALGRDLVDVGKSLQAHSVILYHVAYHPHEAA